MSILGHGGALGKGLKAVGDAPLGEIEAAQKHARAVVDRVGHDLAFREFNS